MKLNETQSPSPITSVLQKEEMGDTILLIDDDDLIHELYGMYPNSISMTLVSVNCGKDGVEIFKKHLDRLSLILVDHNLPDTKGTDLIAELLNISDKIPIILSSRLTPEDFTDLPQSECVKIIQKPTNKLKEWLMKVVETHSLWHPQMAETHHKPEYMNHIKNTVQNIDLFGYERIENLGNSISEKM